MKRRRFWLLAGVFVGGGVVTGALVGPMLSTSAPGFQIAAMWANNYSSLGEMRGAVDAVVLATVVNTRPGRTVMTSFGKNALPFTLVDLQIDEVLRGDVPAKITLEQTGGARDGLAYFANDGGPYESGDQQLLFLNRQPDTNYFYLASPQGRFHVHGGTLTAAVRDEPLAAQLSKHSVMSMRGLIRATNR